MLCHINKHFLISNERGMVMKGGGNSRPQSESEWWQGAVDVRAVSEAAGHARLLVEGGVGWRVVRGWIEAAV